MIRRKLSTEPAVLTSSTLRPRARSRFWYSRPKLSYTPPGWPVASTILLGGVPPSQTALTPISTIVRTIPTIQAIVRRRVSCNHRFGMGAAAG